MAIIGDIFTTVKIELSLILVTGPILSSKQSSNSYANKKEMTIRGDIARMALSRQTQLTNGPTGGLQNVYLSLVAIFKRSRV